jgi:uncharacterized membrane protein
VNEVKDQVLGGAREFARQDLRWSYILIAGMVLLGIIINFAVPKGWTVWPFLFIAGAMSLVHEAAERNGQGVPPFHVYGLLIGVVGGWIILSFLFSILNPFVILIGVVALGLQCLKGYMQERVRNEVIESRRAGGMCVHCGEPVADAKLGMCENCGQEPDPANMRLQRVASIVNQRKDPDRMRAALKQPTLANSAKSREQALVARRQARQNRPPDKRR